MLGRVEARITRRVGRMDERERKKYMKRREILRSVLMVLKQHPGERARRRAHEFCQQMTDLSVDEESPQAPEVPDLPEPAAEPSGATGSSLEGMGEESGYFDQDRVPGRSLEVSSEAAAMSRPDREDTDEGSEIENSESEDTRVARYLNSGMEEVSDPEMWMNLHYLSSDSEIDNEEEQPSGSTGH